MINRYSKFSKYLLIPISSLDGLMQHAGMFHDDRWLKRFEDDTEGVKYCKIMLFADALQFEEHL
jgi:hypothetical protein